MTDTATPTVEKKPVKTEAFTPIRFYLDSPFLQKRIYVKDGRPIQFRNGTYKALTQQEADAIRSARSLLGRVWEEDFPASRETHICDACGYQIRSIDAMIAHQKTHPVMQ